MNTSKNSITDRKPFVDHLTDLRSTILRSLLCILIGMAICFCFVPALIALLKYPLVSMLTAYQHQQPFLRTLKPTGAFIMALRISFTGGLVISLPVILYFLTTFFIPALTTREKKTLPTFFFFGTILFFGGIAFCYFIVLPSALQFLWKFASWLNVQNDWTLEYYISFVLRFLIVFGLAFELPVVLISLVKIRILSFQQLHNTRPYIILIIFVFAAILTPRDIFTQIMLALPLLLLYEISVWTAYLISKKRAENADKKNETTVDK